MILRPFTPEDIEFLYRLRNDPVSRAQSRNTDEIAWKRHVEWCASTPDRILIAVEGRLQVGYIRVLRHPHEYELSITVAPEWRGLGYGTQMLILASRELILDLPLVAYVRLDNLPSTTAFHKAGWRVEGRYIRFAAHPGGGAAGVVRGTPGDSGSSSAPVEWPRVDEGGEG